MEIYLIIFKTKGFPYLRFTETVFLTKRKGSIFLGKILYLVPVMFSVMLQPLNLALVFYDIILQPQHHLAPLSLAGQMLLQHLFGLY